MTSVLTIAMTMDGHERGVPEANREANSRFLDRLLNEGTVQSALDCGGLYVFQNWCGRRDLNCPIPLIIRNLLILHSGPTAQMPHNPAFHCTLIVRRTRAEEKTAPKGFLFNPANL
jgi:hypothetical protein